MTEFARALSLAFASGCLATAAKLLTIWLCSLAGLTAVLGLSVHVSPGLAGFFVRVTEGGLWGLLLLSHWLDRRIILRGLGLSAIVTLFESVVTVAPGINNVLIGWRFDLHQVVTGFLFNIVWGLSAATWYRWVR